MSQSQIYDVTIVGYGPVGAILANLLAKYGLKIAVVERSAEIYDKPRAITLDHEALRVFQACGLAEVMEQAIAPHNGSHYLGVDGDVIKMFNPMPPPYPLGWIPTATFVQPDAERALRDRLSGYEQVDVFLSANGLSVMQDETSVSLTVAVDGGRTFDIKSSYLVGCDGANSFVRKQLGIGLEDLAFDERWMVVDTITSDLTKRPAKSFQYCWPSRPGTFVPGPRNLRRWEIKLLRDDDLDRIGEPDSVLRLLQCFTDTSDLTIWRSAVYRFHALLGKVWRDRRVLLAGDAMHQTPPFLGQGLCAGIRDASNLAWKIALIMRGDAADGLLDSYEIERKPHVRSVVARAKEFGKIIGELDHAAAIARDARLRDELKSGKAETVRQKFIPNLEDGFIATGARLSGSLFVQPYVRGPDGRVTRLDDLLQPEFAIVTTTSRAMSEIPDAILSKWKQIGGERVVIAASGVCSNEAGILTVVEEGQLFAGWMREHNVEAVIVRPDRYVFAGAEHAAQLGGLIEKLLQNLKCGDQEST